MTCKYPLNQNKIEIANQGFPKKITAINKNNITLLKQWLGSFRGTLKFYY